MLTLFVYLYSKFVNVAKLAVQTGLLPLKEAINGKVEHTVTPEDNRDYLFVSALPITTHDPGNIFVNWYSST